MEWTSLLGVFPEEIWGMILDCLPEDYGDLENTINASPFFRNILLPRRTLFLFPKVWEILAIQYQQHHGSESSYSEILNDTLSFPYTICTDCGSERHRKWCSGILNLRTVCRTWRNAINNFSQMIPLNGKLAHVSCTIKDMTVQKFFDDVPQTYSNFLRHFSTTHDFDIERSRFIGNTVSFGSTNQIVSLRLVIYHNEMYHILEKYGCFITNLKIFATYSPSKVPQFYLALKDLLKLTTNLRTLELDVTISTRVEFPEYYAREQYVPHILTQVVIGEPLTPLENLKSLITRNVPAPIFNEILNRCSPNITVCISGDVLGNYEMQNNPFLNLRQLSLRNVSEAEFGRIASSEVQWPLEKLELHFASDVCIESWKIFNLLETNWANTLTELAIGLPEQKDQIKEKYKAACGEWLRLKLHRVKHLKLDLGNHSSLAFIFPMRETLETIHISMECNNIQDDSNIQEASRNISNEHAVQNLINFRQPLESEIWSIFKKLKWIDFEGVFNTSPEFSESIQWKCSREVGLC